MTIGRPRRTTDLYRFALLAYPRRTALMVFLMVVAGLAEGIGVIALIPVLSFADPSHEPSGRIETIVLDGLEFVGITPTLAALLSAIVLAISAKAILLWFAQKQVGFTVAGITRDLRLKLLRNWFDARWGYFASRPIGEFANAMSNETNRTSGAYREACHMLAAIIQMSIYLTIAWAISWKIALGTLVVGALLFGLFRRFFLEGRDAGRDQTRLAKSLGARLVDVLQGIKPLKAMGRQDLVWPMLERETEGLNQAQRRQVLASQGLTKFQEPVLTLLMAIGLYLLLGVGTQPLSSVMVLAFVFYRLMMHINSIQVRYQLMLGGEAAFFSLSDELDAAAAAREPRSASGRLHRLTEGICFEDVCFGYGEHRVLDHVSAEIPAGSFVAIQGESGSGKTTFADLVIGLYQPESGRILVDGVPLSELDLTAWRKGLGYVPQEMLLFNGTIFNNVTLGDESLSRDDAERALRMAGAWDFTCEKQGGMDYHVGERGGTLSGGQRQRIAIARALVTRPSLLILDEVTTALDPATEREICDTLRNLTGDVTILSISHQPAMREVADLVLMMRDGKLLPDRTTAFAG